MKINRFPTKKEALTGAGELLNGLLIKTLKNPTLLMLSAGSALEILGYVDEKTFSENLTVCMLDDRFSKTVDINNFLQLQKTDFYILAQNAGVNFLDTLPRSEEQILDTASRFENNLKTWKAKNTSGIIIATLGMGPDGHTAGIFPETDKKRFIDLFQSDPWVVGYNAKNKHKYPERVTSTLTFFKQINEGIAFVCGQEKKQKLDELLANKTEVNLLPATAWAGIKNLAIFTNLA